MSDHSAIRLTATWHVARDAHTVTAARQPAGGRLALGVTAERKAAICHLPHSFEAQILLVEIFAAHVDGRPRFAAATVNHERITPIVPIVGRLVVIRSSFLLITFWLLWCN
jgi:hypothetical protein